MCLILCGLIFSVFVDQQSITKVLSVKSWISMDMYGAMPSNCKFTMQDF